MSLLDHERPATRADQLFDLADGQAGYFTQQQAAQLGYSRPLQHHYRQTGEWLHPARGIYRLRRYPLTPDEDLVRLSLWSRNQHGQPQAIVSHDTALRLYDLSDLAPADLHLTVPPGFRKRVPAGLILHPARLAPQDIRQASGYRLTTPLRTLLDLANSPLSPEHLGQAVQEALQRGLVRRRALDGALATLPGTAQARLRAALVDG